MSAHLILILASGLFIALKIVVLIRPSGLTVRMRLRGCEKSGTDNLATNQFPHVFAPSQTPIFTASPCRVVDK